MKKLDKTYLYKVSYFMNDLGKEVYKDGYKKYNKRKMSTLQDESENVANFVIANSVEDAYKKINGLNLKYWKPVEFVLQERSITII